MRERACACTEGSGYQTRADQTIEGLARETKRNPCVSLLADKNYGGLTDTEAARAVTHIHRQTDRQTHRTATVTPAHARRGLITLRAARHLLKIE